MNKRTFDESVAGDVKRKRKRKRKQSEENIGGHGEDVHLIGDK